MVGSDARRLAEKLHITEEEAQAALDRVGGDLLDAAIYLERGKPAGDCQVATVSLGVLDTPEEGKKADMAPVKQEVTASQVGEAVRRMLRGLFTHMMENGVEVTYKGNLLLRVPGLALVILALVAFHITVGVLVFGFVMGCRYSLRGPEWDIPLLNDNLDKLWDWRDEMKEELLKAAKNGHKK